MAGAHDHLSFDCGQTFARLDDYLDRELSADELAAVTRHLEICAMCAGEFAVERDLLAQLKAKLRRLAAPESLKRKVAAKLAEQR